MTAGKRAGKDLYCKLTDVLSKKEEEKKLQLLVLKGTAADRRPLAGFEYTFKAKTLGCPHHCSFTAQETALAVRRVGSCTG